MIRLWCLYNVDECHYLLVKPVKEQTLLVPKVEPVCLWTNECFYKYSLCEFVNERVQ